MKIVILIIQTLCFTNLFSIDLNKYDSLIGVDLLTMQNNKFLFEKRDSIECISKKINSNSLWYCDTYTDFDLEFPKCLSKCEFLQTSDFMKAGSKIVQSKINGITNNCSGEIYQMLNIYLLKEILEQTENLKINFSAYVSGYICKSECAYAYIAISVYDYNGDVLAQWNSAVHNTNLNIGNQNFLSISNSIPKDAFVIQISLAARNKCRQIEIDKECVDNKVVFDKLNLMITK